jgi:wyosine [tRNA(Phe)-imidazoG37] synthetase (radical SAM superfamily)
MIVYGPVPSRRLGQSLGINNIPPKICTYSCVYCQLGRTVRMQIRREEFYQPEKLVSDVKARLAELKERKESVDYMTFVPDGEPTLDINLGREIELLRSFGVKTAVITNASLIWDADVRNVLAKADWVSLKVDAISERIWRRINRPYRDLKLEAILDGMVEFSTDFDGTLATETMLIRGINDGKDEVEGIADFLETLSPDKSHIAIPTRPPAEKWVRPADESSINMAYQIFSRGLSTEYLIGYEGNSFASTGDPEEDLLSITSVHPMREEGVEELLKKANSGWEIVKSLVYESKLVELEYEGKTFYMRKLPGVRRS